MSDQLSAAAAALGVPEPILKRSAEARAKATGSTVDEILAAWAGGSPAPEAPASMPEPDAAVPPPAAEPDAGREDQVVEEAEVDRPGPQVAPRTPSQVPPAPTEVTPKEAVRFPVVVTVPTAGLKERTAAAVPWWLAACFVIIPLFGLLQLASASANECGSGIELLPDRVTGELRNCDGSEFEGRQQGGGGADFIAMGGELYVGAAACAGCHGSGGEGVSAPALTTVIATFSSCLDHIEWVTKGTPGFQSEGRSTYGDLNKPVGGAGVMPGFGASLSAEQIAAVAAFERVRFGGQDAQSALTDCGLAEAPPEEGEADGGAEGEAGTEGEAGEQQGQEGATTTLVP